jgi:hypothetical protein
MVLAVHEPAGHWRLRARFVKMCKPPRGACRSPRRPKAGRRVSSPAFSGIHVREQRAKSKRRAPDLAGGPACALRSRAGEAMCTRLRVTSWMLRLGCEGTHDEVADGHRPRGRAPAWLRDDEGARQVHRAGVRAAALLRPGPAGVLLPAWPGVPALRICPRHLRSTASVRPPGIYRRGDREGRGERDEPEHRGEHGDEDADAGSSAAIELRTDTTGRKRMTATVTSGTGR